MTEITPDYEALDQLKRVIRETSDDDFDMRQWACGPVGCALGRAAMDPWFNSRGLVLKQRYNETRQVPTVDGSWGHEAAAIIFSILLRDAHRIFSPTFYRSYFRREPISRQDVLDRIDAILDELRL